MTTETTVNNLDAYLAEIDAHLSELVEKAAGEESERERRKQSLVDMAADEIKEFLFTANPPAAAVLTRNIKMKKPGGNSESVFIEAKIETEGLAPIYIEARAKWNPAGAQVTEMGTRDARWSNCTPDNFRSLLIAARAEWLKQDAKRRADEQQRQEQRAALDAALAAWEPAYRAYLSALDAAYTWNAAILRKIAGALATTPFEVRRLTYGIVYGEGADPATDDAWIISRSTRNETEEIGNDGIIFDTRYYNPVSVTAPMVWTPARCREEHAWSTGKRPPIRRYTRYGAWLTVEFFAPPSRRPLDAEVNDAIFHAGGLLDWPTPPTPPAPPAPQWEELILRRAADLAAELLSTAAHDEIGERAIRTVISDFDF